MKSNWSLKILPATIPNPPNLPEVILKLLALRGILDETAIRDFLNPEYEKLFDPYRFRQMQAAVDRIRKAIANQEKIVIYADYDADAITACAVVYLTLKKLGSNVGHYIPDRFAEGYGLNSEAIRQIAADGARVIITVDCGI